MEVAINFWSLLILPGGGGVGCSVFAVSKAGCSVCSAGPWDSGIRWGLAIYVYPDRLTCVILQWWPGVLWGVMITIIIRVFIRVAIAGD